MQGPDAVTASGPFFLDNDRYNQKKIVSLQQNMMLR